MKRVSHVFLLSDIFLTYIVLSIITTSMISLLTRDLVTGLAMYVSLMGWWGWPFRHLSLNQVWEITLSIVTPLVVAVLIRYVTIHKPALRGLMGIIISITAYYVIGSIYYVIPVTMKPDIDLALMFPVWISLLLISSIISHALFNTLRRYSIMLHRDAL